ncbi:GDP-L-fucose synthase family protein [Ruminiclostridium cellulolyticum]|uniref:GDP-L-fucose synthase n=1 Tax=Ruminiclostridium cellulolyticum (strain ATCC 35319 / DSM 5812 / JCM 6584 / H10) TaxID=394503 RepID=B8I1U5_RUMCH|nr:GDP-L-fucose synthase [Ruminiclostridium cellulolyticum]ACL77730.1 NAD-dependent epimerase/dehydratase [Ruminiclostridium cellulolyticum H10]
MNKESKIFVAGHTGMVGSAIVRRLQKNGYENIICKSHKELDLTDQSSTEYFFRDEKPDYVFLAAAKVGGIHANNSYPADFIMENMLIECNVIKSSYKNGVKKLMFLGSSCIYPKLCPQPIKEEYLLTGELEPTNEAYALAKISGIKMCQSYNKQYHTIFISAMPASLYGVNDRFDINNSHVIPSMIIKLHEAKINNKPYVELWGTGNPLREFLYVDDMADACLYLMQNYEENEFVNIGSGKEISIRKLAETLKLVIGYNGELLFDTTKPDGTPRRVLDNTRIYKTGWRPQVDMEEGLQREYEYYLKYVVS